MANIILDKIKGHPHITEGTAYAILFTMGLCHLLNDMIQSVIPAIYPLLKDSYGFTFAQIGIITLVFQMTSSIFQPFIGNYADRHPQPYFMAMGMGFMLLGLLALAYSSSFMLILASVAVIGCGSSVFHPEASRVAQLASGGKKSLAQSIFQVGGNALAAMLAAVLLTRVGCWYSMLLSSARTAQHKVQHAVCSLPSKTVNSAMAILVLMIFSKYFFNACMTSYFTFYLIEKFGVTVQQSQICLFAYLAAFAVGTLAGGFLGDRYGRKYVILFSILGAAPFTLIMPYLNLFGTIVTAIVTGLIIASAFSAIVVYATDLKPDKVGMVAGIFFGLMFGLGGIGSAFFGWIADLTSIGFIFKVSTWLPLLGIVAWFLPNVKPAGAA